MENVTTHQIWLLHHTLGVGEFSQVSNRNYFLAGEGTEDYDGLLGLVEKGLMTKQDAPKWAVGEFYFSATRTGKAFAMEVLPPPPPPRKRSKYEDYLDADVCYSFAEWMGIEVPEREVKMTFWGEPKQLRLKTSKVDGPWATTLKEAKAGYKAKLAKYKEYKKAGIYSTEFKGY